MSSIIDFSKTSPAQLAQQLAGSSVADAQSLLTNQAKSAQSTSSALTSLQSALSTFQSALTSLSGTSTSGLAKFSATVSGADAGTASASSTAQAGTYQFYVQQLATAQRLLFQNVPSVPTSQTGTLGVSLGDGTTFSVDLTTADSDGDGTVTAAEVARALNQAPGNAGKVTASVVTVNGQSQLQLGSANTGANSAITLDTSGLQASGLKSALGSSQVLSQAQDAIVWFGGQGGVQMQQASNTFTGITGVNLTFTRAMSATETPLTLTVAQDASGTAGNVQKFVDAYNALKGSLDKLTQLGNSDSGTSSAALAEDSGVIALRDRLNQLMRQSFGGLTLVNLGVTANRDGTLSLDQTRLQNTLTSNPGALDKVFGKSSLTNNSGVLGSLNTYLKSWLDSSSGQINTRQATIQAQQKRLNDQQARLTDRYNNLYQTYLTQFSQLQALESRMSQTSGLFDTLLSNSKN